ncbi:MAG: hypothetical protein U0791_20220 [Gemmataceae bacterium]
MVRRLLPLAFAAAALGPIPACVTISSQTSPEQPAVAPAKPQRPSEFASFPRRPGEVALKNPELVAAKPQPQSEQEPSDPSDPAEPASAPIADANVQPAAIPPVGIPSPTEPALLAAFRAYSENRPDDAIKQLATLDRATQDYALALMPLLVRGTQMKWETANPEDAAVVVEQLHALAARLEAKAALKVEKVAFCRKITGFGRFDPWPEGQPYKPNDLAVLYVELKNLGSEPVPGAGGETWLSRANVSLEVRDATGKLVEQTDPTDWRKRVPVARFEHADHSRSPLHDYCRTYRISVPAQPGVYTVTVEVKDVSGKRVARSQPAEFRVAGP